MKELLTGEQVHLRALEPTDIDTVLAWENDTTSWDTSDTVAPMSRATLWQYLQDYVADIYRQGELRLIIEHNTTRDIIGMVELRDFSALNNRAEVGVFIAPQWRGERYATQAMSLTVDYAGEYLGIRSLYCYVPVDNVASERMLTACGFEPIGTLHSWIRRGNVYRDAVIMQLVL